MQTTRFMALFRTFKAQICLLFLLGAGPLKVAAALPEYCRVTENLSKLEYNNDYKVISQTCDAPDGSVRLHAIRRFKSPLGEDILLTVDPNSQDTNLIYESCLGCRDAKLSSGDNYGANVLKGTSAPYLLENDGLTHSLNKLNDAVLTIDLCPSTKLFEKRVFKQLLRTDLPRPIPVAISISGSWMRRYTDDFKYLLDLQHSGQIEITFINHSYSHPFVKTLADQHNFLLKDGVDFKFEVLNLEVALIRRGITPSVYFRFPGLISDERLMRALRSYGLIPLGADAWLAKGQKPSGGSLILIHGNGNETEGGDIFINRYLNHMDDLDSLEDAFGSQGGQDLH